jgi:hypothetical protein
MEKLARRKKMKLQENDNVATINIGSVDDIKAAMKLHLEYINTHMNIEKQNGDFENYICVLKLFTLMEHTD